MKVSIKYSLIFEATHPVLFQFSCTPQYPGAYKRSLCAFHFLVLRLFCGRWLPPKLRSNPGQTCVLQQRSLYSCFGLERAAHTQLLIRRDRRLEAFQDCRLSPEYLQIITTKHNFPLNSSSKLWCVVWQFKKTQGWKTHAFFRRRFIFWLEFSPYKAL